jgi:hypothetical protein
MPDLAYAVGLPIDGPTALAVVADIKPNGRRTQQRSLANLGAAAFFHKSRAGRIRFTRVGGGGIGRPVA